MAESPTPDNTHGVNSFSSEQMVAELYTELRRLAFAKMKKLAPGQTLQATALVHEAYLRLSREPAQRSENPGHFFASAAEAMRRILIDQARRRAALRRAGNSKRAPLEEIEVQSPEPEERLLEVHEVLEALELENRLRAQIVKLRFFAGLNHSEVSAKRADAAASKWFLKKIGTKRTRITSHHW